MNFEVFSPDVAVAISSSRLDHPGIGGFGVGLMLLDTRAWI